MPVQSFHAKLELGCSSSFAGHKVRPLHNNEDAQYVLDVGRQRVLGSSLAEHNRTQSRSMSMKV